MTAVTPLRRAGSAVLASVPAAPERTTAAPAPAEQTCPAHVDSNQTVTAETRLMVVPSPGDEAREI